MFCGICQIDLCQTPTPDLFGMSSAYLTAPSFTVTDRQAICGIHNTYIGGTQVLKPTVCGQDIRGNPKSPREISTTTQVPAALIITCALLFQSATTASKCVTSAVAPCADKAEKIPISSALNTVPRVFFSYDEKNV